MPIDEIYKLPITGEWSTETAAALQKVLTHIHENAVGCQFTDTAPTKVEPGKIVFFDDGTDQRMYFKGAEGNVDYADKNETTSTHSGAFTRSMQAASGDVSYTGVGFTPSLVLFFMIGEGMQTCSFGYSNGTTHECLGHADDNANWYYKSTCIFQRETWHATDLNVGQSAVVKTLDSDGFTLTWTKAGSPTDITAKGWYLAIE